MAPEVLPSPVLGAGASENNEAAGFGFPNKGAVGFVLLISPKMGFAGATAGTLFPAAALGIGAKNPLNIGFISALPPLEGIGDGVAKIFPIDELAGNPNNPPVSPVPTVPESVSLVTSGLNAIGVGFVLSGFGEGVLSF